MRALRVFRAAVGRVVGRGQSLSAGASAGTPVCVTEMKVPPYAFPVVSGFKARYPDLRHGIAPVIAEDGLVLLHTNVPGQHI